MTDGCRHFGSTWCKKSNDGLAVWAICCKTKHIKLFVLFLLVNTALLLFK